jgi:hypothetical protein
MHAVTLRLLPGCWAGLTDLQSLNGDRKMNA